MAHAASATLPQATKLLNLVEDQGLTPDDFQKILSHGLLADILTCNPCEVDRVALQQFLGIRIIVNTEVHRNDWSLEKMIELANYRRVTDFYQPYNKIHHQEPIPNTNGATEIHLIRFGRTMARGQAIMKLRGWNLRPADFAEHISVEFGRSSRLANITFACLGSWIYNAREHRKNNPVLAHHPITFSDPHRCLSFQPESSGDSSPRGFPGYYYFTAVPIP